MEVSLPEGTNKQAIIAYLLGRMDPVTKERFEDRYFADSALFDQIDVVEQELLEQFLDGTLPYKQRAQMKKQLRNNPHRRKRMEVLRALQERRGPAGARSPYQYVPRLASAFAVAFLLTAAVAIHLWTENGQLRQTVQDLSRAAARSPAPGGAAPAVLTDHFTLHERRSSREPGRGGPQRVERNVNAALVEIVLSFLDASSTRHYTALLLDADGVERASVSGLRAIPAEAAYRLSVLLPATMLQQGSYVIRLKDNSSRQIVASFAFDVFVR